MGHTDFTDTADDRVAGASAENSENLTRSTTTRPSAIERQLAATSGHWDHTANRSALDNTAPHKSSRYGLASFLTLFLIVAAALALLFADTGHPLQNTILHNAASAIQQVAGQVAGNASLPATYPPPTISPAPTSNPAPASAAQTSANVSQTSASASQTSTRASQTLASTSPASASTPQATAPINTGKVSTADAVSIPVADVSLRNRPELLKQLVQIYRSQLASDPNNSTARTALNQLQERSLSELQSIVMEGDDAAAVKSLEIVSDIFPEATDNARYKYLLARTDRIRHQTKEEPAAKPEASPLAPITHSSPAMSPEKNVLPAVNSSTAGAKKIVEDVLSTKPQIRALSIVAGRMVNDRFIPSDDGDVFMVEISYRNLNAIAESSEGVSLVARLGIPGDYSVLAEVPVELLGDRGKKSFVIANVMPGNSGGKYLLNFILNGEFLASSTLRLSMPEQ